MSWSEEPWVNKKYGIGNVAVIWLVCLCCIFAGCETTAKAPTPTSKGRYRLGDELLARTTPLFQTHIWHRMANNFNIKTTGHARINHFVNRYRNDAYHLKQLSQRAKPYLYYVVSSLEARNLPGELALLPAIESAYRPSAISNKGAAGLWQLGPTTATHLGLKRSGSFDARHDIEASTQAALDYLESLHRTFNADWPLALAAYNCGPGCVRRAIQRNRRHGKPTDFWSLRLPRQTREFVPKILAMAQIIKTPHRYGMQLPIIKNQPYFQPVNFDTPVNLNFVARLAGVNIKELRRLNPALRNRKQAQQGQYRLLVPTSHLTQLRQRLANCQLAKSVTHAVKRGDTLSHLAMLYQTSVCDIKFVNQLRDDHIKQGQTLVIPVSETA